MANWFEDLVESAKDVGDAIAREFGSRILNVPSDAGTGVTTDPGAYRANGPGPEQRAPANTSGQDAATNAGAVGLPGWGWAAGALLLGALVWAVAKD